MRATRKADPHAGRRTRRDLTPIFDEYLRQAPLPTLDLEFVGSGQVAYRWTAGVQGFNMPFEVAADLYYVNVSTQ